MAGSTGTQNEELREEQNLELAATSADTERLVARFYSTYPYPWRPYKFDYVEDPPFYARLLAQELGRWDGRLLPEEPRIWVAGCGTNQSVVTALRYPQALVIGSDISTKSLELAERTAHELQLQNVSVREESIVDAGYEETFDLIICTGVVHHNREPALALEGLAEALKPDGVIELMVYNRFHRVVTSAFQRAIRILNRTGALDEDGHEFEQDVRTAQALLETVDEGSWLDDFLGGFEHKHDAAVADALVNPVEHSFTVRSLAELADRCGLRLVAPCVNVFDVTRDTWDWEPRIADPDTRARYEALPDVERWYVTNLVRFERSPGLWFYLQHQDAPSPIGTVAELCESFLATTFVRAEATQRNFLLGQDDRYRLAPRAVKLPAGAAPERARPILDLVDGQRPMRELFSQAGIEPRFEEVNAIRLALTTTQFPYLIAA